MSGHSLLVETEIESSAERVWAILTDFAAYPEWNPFIFYCRIFDGEHRFMIQPIAHGTVLFQQSEQFRGILVPLFRTSLDRNTKRGFAEMNSALKVRAEAFEL